MQTPFRLTRRSRPEPATALLLLTHDARELLKLGSRLGLDPLPDLFATADGFLLLVGTEVQRATPHTVRLRQLDEFLLVPADADLEPQLLPDETRGLTRDRGLIFLPGGRVLEFDPEAPLGLAALLRPHSLRRDDWSSVPAPRRLAESIRSIRVELPHDDPESLLAAGGEDIGTEDPRPDAGTPAENVTNRTRLGLGRILSRLGRALGMDRLRETGERMMRRAAEEVPRLGEGVYGAQEAALRDLLKLFQSGEVDKALRRAIPKTTEPGYRGREQTGAALPTHDLRYSLSNLLGQQGGSASVWSGHDDVITALFREYRKAAEEASNRGDYRRAAFIYGKLLAEWRAAADVLARGGLHHDAAVLYRDRVGDHRRAATAFEAAGEFDEALQIYDRHAMHEQAGDLLRRLGEEDAAIDRYLRAAEAIMQLGRGPLRAGEFLLDRTGRSDLAETYFAAGWSMRNVSTQLGDAVPCATHLARIYSKYQTPAKFLELLGEAETFTATPGNAPAAGNLLNSFARLADQPLFHECRDEIRDRCLLALAVKLREHVGHETRPGNIISMLLGESGIWEAPVVRDASVALRAALKEPRESPRAEGPVTILHLGSGIVTAARVAPRTGEVFVAFDSGRIVGFRPSEPRMIPVGEARGPVAALSTSLDGKFVVAATGAPPDATDGSAVLQAFACSPSHGFEASGRTSLLGIRETGLAPLIINGDSESLVVVRHGPAPDDLSLYRGPDLLAISEGDQDLDDDWPIDLPLPKAVPACEGAAVLVLQKGAASLCLLRQRQTLERRILSPALLDWAPYLPPGSTLGKPPASWHQHQPGVVEVAGLNDAAAVYWVDLRVGRFGVRAHRVLVTGCREGYRTVMLIRPGVLAAVTATNRLIWLRAEGDRLTEWATAQRLTSLSPAVACFFSSPTNELLVILANGYLVRIPVPS